MSNRFDKDKMILLSILNSQRKWQNRHQGDMTKEYFNFLNNQCIKNQFDFKF